MHIMGVNGVRRAVSHLNALIVEGTQQDRFAGDITHLTRLGLVKVLAHECDLHRIAYGNKQVMSIMSLIDVYIFRYIFIHM